MMALPKGTFKGLSRVLAPLSFWMAAGWAAYPYIIVRIMDDVGESIDADEVRLFSMAMVAACIGIGIALGVYGFTGKDADEGEIKALAKPLPLCPYCGAMVIQGSEVCQACKETFPK
jgi:Na+/proline symporter